MVADAGALLLARLAQGALGWFGTLLIVRSLSHTAWGEFTFVFNVLGLAFIVSSAVGPRTAIRGLIEEMDAGDAGRFVGSYTILRGLLGIAAYSIAVGIAVVGGYPSPVIRAMALAGLVVVISSVSAALSLVFQVTQQMTRWAVAQAAGQLAQLGLTVGLYVAGASMVVFTIPAVLCEVVVLLLALRALQPLLRVKPGLMVSTWGALVRTAIPIAIGQALFAIYNSIDSIMLSKMKSFTAVGSYGIAYKFSNIVAVVPFAMSAAIMAALVRSWPARPQEFWGAFRRAIQLLSMIAVVVIAEFAVFASPLVRVLYGAQYGAAANAARLVVAAACVSYFTVLVTTTLTAQGRNAFYLLAGAGGVVINVCANLVAISRWSYNGAAWVTLGTEVIVLAVVAPALMRGHTAEIRTWRIATTSLFGVLCLAQALVARALLPWVPALALSSLFALVMLHVMRVPGRRGFRSLLADTDA